MLTFALNALPHLKFFMDTSVPVGLKRLWRQIESYVDKRHDMDGAKLARMFREFDADGARLNTKKGGGHIASLRHTSFLTPSPRTVTAAPASMTARERRSGG